MSRRLAGVLRQIIIVDIESLLMASLFDDIKGI
jgi:hypothetical protein